MSDSYISNTTTLESDNNKSTIIFDKLKTALSEAITRGTYVNSNRIFDILKDQNISYLTKFAIQFLYKKSDIKKQKEAIPPLMTDDAAKKFFDEKTDRSLDFKEKLIRNLTTEGLNYIFSAIQDHFEKTFNFHNLLLQDKCNFLISQLKGIPSCFEKREIEQKNLNTSQLDPNRDLFEFNLTCFEKKEIEQKNLNTSQLDPNNDLFEFNLKKDTKKLSIPIPRHIMQNILSHLEMDRLFLNTMGVINSQFYLLTLQMYADLKKSGIKLYIKNFSHIPLPVIKIATNLCIELSSKLIKTLNVLEKESSPIYDTIKSNLNTITIMKMDKKNSLFFQEKFMIKKLKLNDFSKQMIKFLIPNIFPHLTTLSCLNYCDPIKQKPKYNTIFDQITCLELYGNCELFKLFSVNNKLNTLTLHSFFNNIILKDLPNIDKIINNVTSLCLDKFVFDTTLAQFISGFKNITCLKLELKLELKLVNINQNISQFDNNIIIGTKLTEIQLILTTVILDPYFLNNPKYNSIVLSLFKSICNQINNYAKNNISLIFHNKVIYALNEHFFLNDNKYENDAIYNSIDYDIIYKKYPITDNVFDIYFSQLNPQDNKFDILFKKIFQILLTLVNDISFDVKMNLHTYHYNYIELEEKIESELQQCNKTINNNDSILEELEMKHDIPINIFKRERGLKKETLMNQYWIDLKKINTNLLNSCTVDEGVSHVKKQNKTNNQ